MTQKKCYITIETFTRSSLFSLSMFDQTPSLVESTMIVDLDKLSATLAGIGADSNKKVKRIVVGEEISFITTYEVPDLMKFKVPEESDKVDSNHKYKSDKVNEQKLQDGRELYLNANTSELSNEPITQEELSKGQRVVNLKPLTDDEMFDMSMTKSQFDKLHTGPREREVGEQPFKPASREELMAFDNVDLPELPGKKDTLDAINPQDRGFSTIKKFVTTSYPRDPHGPMLDSVEDIDEEEGTPIGKDLEKATYEEEDSDDESNALFDDHYSDGSEAPDLGPDSENDKGGLNYEVGGKVLIKDGVIQDTKTPDFFFNKETKRYESVLTSLTIEDLDIDDFTNVDTDASYSAGHVVFERDYVPTSLRVAEPEVIEEPVAEVIVPKETLASALSNAIDKSTEAKVTKKIEDRDYPEMGGVSEHRRSMQQNKIVMPKIEHNPPTRKKTFTRR